MVVFRPTEHKGFTVRPRCQDKSVGPMPVMMDVGTEPTCFESGSDAGDLETDDEMDDEEDGAEDDPDWEPEDESDEEYASDEEENIQYVFMKTGIVE